MDRPDEGFVVENRACCIPCGKSAPSDQLKQELQTLERRARDLRRTLQQAPFYRIAAYNNLTPQAYGDIHGNALLARRSEIEQDQDKLFTDTIFTNFLRFYYRDIFDLATFEARALEAVLQKQQKIEEANRQHLQELFTRYQPCDHYEDDTWIIDYAAQNRRDLLRRRDEILREYREFHSDESFIAYLKERAPYIYKRSLYELRALIAAERHKETPEEHRERQERIAWGRFEDDIAVEVEIIKQNIARDIRMAEFQRKLEQELPEHQEIVQETFRRHREGGQPNEQKPPPRIL